jgi:hypothetical protein
MPDSECDFAVIVENISAVSDKKQFHFGKQVKEQKENLCGVERQ